MPNSPAAINEALAKFPKASRYRDYIPRLATDDENSIDKAYHEVRELREQKISEDEAKALLEAAASLEFGEHQHDWKDGLHELLFILVTNPFASLPPLMAKAYERQKGVKRRCALLAALGAIETRDAAETFMQCVRDFGWPDGLYARVSWELPKLLKYADVLLPDVLTTAGKSATAIGDAVITAISENVIDPKKYAAQLEGIAPFARKALKKAMTSAAKKQKPSGVEWRFAERYHESRHATCMLLDLAGHLKSPALLPLLKEAIDFKDPRVVTFAALSLLRRGEKVPTSALNKSAACHETRAILFNGLRDLKLEPRFPKKWRTWEAFGAAQMVEWLSFPSELGREPDEIKLGLTSVLDKRTKLTVHLWKFRVKGEPWLAGMSGPYELKGDPQPLYGRFTFSKFEEWDSKTRAQHLDSIAQTMDQWQKNK